MNYKLSLKTKIENSLLSSGFTLIEVLIGGFLLAVIAVLVNNILFSTFKGITKSEVLKEVKQNGDYALSVMQRMIKDAKKISSCSSSEISIINHDVDDPDQSESRHTTTFKCLKDAGVLRIASSSAVTGDRMLSSSKNVTLTGSACPGSLTFNCSQSAGRPSQVEVSFTLKQKGTAARAEEAASVDFHTTITLRNY